MHEEVVRVYCVGVSSCMCEPVSVYMIVCGCMCIGVNCEVECEQMSMCACE